VRSPDYSTVDVLRTLRGIRASQAALLPQLATTDLIRTVPRLDVPLVMTQGRHDQAAPGKAAQRFHDSLTAPTKALVWFESSAHTPHLEEPGKFRDLLMSVRAGQLPTTWRRNGRIKPRSLSAGGWVTPVIERPASPFAPRRVALPWLGELLDRFAVEDHESLMESLEVLIVRQAVADIREAE
jgi:hypothetical protein